MLLAVTTLIFSLVFFEIAELQAADLRFMSFNIRRNREWVFEQAPENNWNNPKHPRRERVIRVIRENTPDVLGVQEARDQQIIDLREALPEFDFYGIGRDDGKTEGEYSAIFFRKKRFTQKDAGSFWLSATPEKPGTTFSTIDKAPPRIASWVRLVDKDANREFLVLNMHWDNASKPARRKSASLVRRRFAKLCGGLPAIVMGDLNGDEDSREFATLLAKDDSQLRVLADSYRVIHPKRLPDEASANDWNGRRAGSRIDFILHTDDFTPTAADIIRTSYDGFWPSDHYPVTATLRFQDAAH